MRSIILFLLLTGCAALKGQWTYDGPPGDAPKMTYVRRTQPAPHHLGSVMLLGQNNMSSLAVENPTGNPILVSIDCDNLYTLYLDEPVPPMTGQAFLLHGDERSCSMTWRRDPGEVRRGAKDFSLKPDPVNVPGLLRSDSVHDG